ncbi:hypothetical protein ABT324_09160 [Saccharopolyspora sp. NPDC000359]
MVTGLAAPRLVSGGHHHAPPGGCADPLDAPDDAEPELTDHAAEP